MIDIIVQSIDGLNLKTFKMIMTNFKINNKLGCSRFFQIFFIAKISMKVILYILFLSFCNANILFIEQKLT